MFRGREITYVDQGFKIMNQLIERVKDIAVVESPPKVEGKKLIMVLLLLRVARGLVPPRLGSLRLSVSQSKKLRLNRHLSSLTALGFFE